MRFRPLPFLQGGLVAMAVMLAAPDWGITRQLVLMFVIDVILLCQQYATAECIRENVTR